MHTPIMNETIVAIATPPGQGAIGIVRLSGPASRAIGESLFQSGRPNFSGLKPHRLHHGQLRTPQGEFLDDALLAFMPGPASFTGEDVLEAHCHGGQIVLRRVVQACLDLGARLAEAGEFSRRAVINGRMDLTQAEAIMELIAARSEAAAIQAGNRLGGLLGRKIQDLRSRLEGLRQQLCVAVDFPEDEVECLPPGELAAGLTQTKSAMLDLAGNYERSRCWRDGALVVLAGQVNAGKSSLLNAILGADRAIVTDIPGTTRDYLEEAILLDGLPVRLVDTAGMRPTTDHVELIGVERSRALLAQADLGVLVIDAELGPGAEDLDLAASTPGAIIVANKMDLTPERPAWLDQQPWIDRTLCLISAKQGQGVDGLLATVRRHLVETEPLADELVPNLRQHDALIQAAAELERMERELDAGVPYDVLTVSLDTACAILAEITGEITPQAVLDAVFDGFCIGK
ncbi:MAG: tRNA uridine-5-carboxymethylaminomethyl(34) synthesis GTPase MnmE [Deltaproteobacteria bacterium]|nr:tRNA uridine-5-carboxymethylaminomethyl(34) synthesis GTPase MnmE [Deltaproteobacteria bacterium]